MIEQMLAHGGEERIGFNPLARVHAVVGGPVLSETAGSTEQGSHRVSTEADDLRQDVPGQAGTHPGG